MDQKKIKQLRHRLRKDSDIGIHGVIDSDAIRAEEDEDNKYYADIRPPFFRDVDRIVHSKAYARYIDKTQVFFNINNANITHRSLHVILVSRISRQIGRVLKLNTDLIEGVALGHDIGHPPFGHIGEHILNDIGKEYGLGLFLHNAQSVRWLSFLEKRFPTKPAKGLNLTLQVLDGILCHDGEIEEQELKPIKKNGKTFADHFKEYNDAFSENKVKRIPATYEGVAVRFADDISYIGRDIEDAILLKFIKRDDIPENCKKVLGDSNRKIMNILIMDLLLYSMENDTIGYSPEVYDAFKELKRFNFENIYLRRDLLNIEGTDISFTESLKEKMELIFERSLIDLEQEDFNAPIFKDHIEYIDDESFESYYKKLKNEKKLSLIVRDYIAGMSDKYFNESYENLTKK